MDVRPFIRRWAGEPRFVAFWHPPSDSEAASRLNLWVSNSGHPFFPVPGDQATGERSPAVRNIGIFPKVASTHNLYAELCTIIRDRMCRDLNTMEGPRSNHFAPEDDRTDVRPLLDGWQKILRQRHAQHGFLHLTASLLSRQGYSRRG